MPIDPTDAQRQAMGRLPPGQPVVMLNLMKLRERSADGDGSGWDAYLRYSRGFAPLLKACGGTILWAGNAQGVAIGDDAQDDWDYVALVWYPRPGEFVATVGSAAYAAINHHRHNALQRHLILPVTETYSKLLHEA